MPGNRPNRAGVTDTTAPATVGAAKSMPQLNFLVPVQVSGLTDITGGAGGLDIGYAVWGDGRCRPGFGWDGALGNGGTDESSPALTQVTRSDNGPSGHGSS